MLIMETRETSESLSTQVSCKRFFFRIQNQGHFADVSFLVSCYFLISSTSKQFIAYKSASKIKKTWNYLCCLNEEMFLLFVRLIQRSKTFLVGKTSESNGTRSWNCTNRTKCLTMLVFLPPCNVPS